MSFIDLSYIFQWWFTIFIVGIIFFPLTSLVFSSFFDKGYIFSKILGIAFISYSVFILGILKIFTFSFPTIAIVLIIFFIINIFIIIKYPNILKSLKDSLRMFMLEEIIFFINLIFWSFIHSYQSDIHGLEKYMDFGFVNSILRSDYFPPKDMWLTPFYINYYYFGHLVTAVLTKLSNIPSPITYNLMLATISGFTFVGAFSIGANLIYKISKHESRNSKSFRISDFGFRILFGGFLSGLIITFAGNLHSIYLFFKSYANDVPVPFWQLMFSPLTFPNSYWYPNATRFIYNTIHEFPIYSFVVSDLHGHVLDIPFVLLTIAILLSLVLKLQITNRKSQINLNVQSSKRFGFLNFKNFNLSGISNFDIRILLLISFLLAIMYMTNAWDGIIYFLLTAFVILYVTSKPKDCSVSNEIKNEKLKIKIKNWIIYLIILSVGLFVFTLPFNINFKPFASGIGILCAPKFLTDIGNFGPFLFEKNHCQHSPFWQLLILYGFFYFWVISFIVVLLKNYKLDHLNFIKNLKLKIENLSTSDIFVLILIILSTILIIIPEFIYVKDIYPAHYRANTMFKLVYQSFIMLSIASAYIAIRLMSNIKNQISKMQIRNRIFNFYYAYLLFAIVFFILVFLYPYFAINSYFGNLKINYGLNGIKYFKTLYPNDFDAISWINKNIKGQPVILEAQGDSYTDYGRVSTNTGLPTVLGWTVHEWLWRGTYDVPSPRIPQIITMYESKDIKETKNLLKKYNISLVFIGALEEEKYPNLNENKFKLLGKIIYENDSTKIYRIN